MDSQRTPFRYSYFQLTFGQEEAYRRPHLTYERLRRFGYDAIEICPPKGRYGLGVSMEDYLATHLRLKADSRPGRLQRQRVLGRDVGPLFAELQDAHRAQDG